MIFWIILFVVVVGVSLFLAFRSMRDFQQIPTTLKLNYGLFLVRNKRNLNSQTLKKIFTFSLSNKAIISFERLFKGKEHVLTLYAPTNLITQLPELEPLELEDYLDHQDPNPQVINQKKISVNDSIAWLISSKNNPKRQLSTKSNFLRWVDLEENQQVSFQIVGMAQTPKEKEEDQIKFQVTIRTLVAEKDPNKRIELSKKIEKEIIESTGLLKQAREHPTAVIFKTFYQRTLIPQQVSQFILTGDEILGLLGL